MSSEMSNGEIAAALALAAITTIFMTWIAGNFFPG